MGRFSVSVLFKDVRCDVEWVATSVYGPTNVNEKADFWAELNQLARLWNCPRMLGGDFNVIRFPTERKRGCSSSPSMREFNNWFRSHDL